MRTIKMLLVSVTLLIVSGLFTMTASADTYTWQCGDSVKASYDTYTGYMSITGTGAMYDDWKTPSYAGMKTIYIGSGVTSISDGAFENLHVTSVTLPATLTSIGHAAFSGCSNLESITIPNNVTSMGTYVFSSCSSLTDVTLGSGITKIPDHTFSNCYALSSVVIPNSVKEIGEAAFNLCYSGLTSINIPDSVTVIGNSAFSACRSLETVNMSGQIETIGELAFYDTLIKTIELPNTLRTIGVSAFRSCDYLSEIILPDGLTSISETAFNDCIGLTEVTIPPSVSSVGNDAFKGCTNLQTVNYTAINCSSMGNKSNPVFNGCVALQNINIASNVRTIPSHAFYGCATVEKIIFPNSIKSMGSNVIGGCNSLKELSIPFVGSKRGNTGTYDACLGYIFDFETTYYISGSTGYVSQAYLGHGYNTYITFFMPLTLTKIAVTDETVIGVGALSNLHSVTEVFLPDTLSKIEKEAFMDGEVLAKINLPINLTYMGEDAFTRCFSLTDVTFNAKKCSGEYDSFTWSGGNTELTIGESVETLPSFSGLKTAVVNFNAINCTSTGYRFNYDTKIVNIGEKVGRLPAYIFGNCLISSIDIPDSVTYIGDMAFVNCTGLTEVSIPDSVKTLGSLIFAGCDNIKAIKIGSGLKSMNFLMFSDGANVEEYIVNPLNSYFSSVDGNLYNKNKTTLIHYAPGKEDEIFVVPSTVVTLGDYSMRWSKIKKISLPDSVADLGTDTFYGCTNLESINIPDSIIEIKEDVFYGCGALCNILISSDVVSIGKNAFANTGIKTITLSKNIINIGDCAFQYSKSLSSVTFETKNATIGLRAFDSCANLKTIYCYRNSTADDYFDSNIYTKIYLDNVPVTGVTLNKTTATLTEGDKLTLTATIAPTNATNKNVTWKSSDTTVATVSNGVVTAKKAGTVTITVTTADGSKTATCTVTVKAAFDPDALTFTVESAKAIAGKTATVDIVISNNPGIAGFSFKVGYDSSVMTLIGYDCPGWAANSSGFDEDPANNPVGFSWSRTTNYTSNKTILTLTFEIKTDATAGEYDISLTTTDVVTNQDKEKLNFNLVGGKITVVESEPGDLSGDGDINSIDAVLLAQYIAGWDVELDGMAADCNGDGEINSIDAVLLAQYIAGWDVVLG